MLFVKVKAAALVLAVVGLAIYGGLLTHRLLAAQRSPEAGSADAAPREEAQPVKQAELKVLDRLAGKWRYEWESQPTEGEPKGSKGTGTSTNEWILDGWFQQHKGKGDNPPTKSSRSGPTMHTQRRAEPGGLWPPAQITTNRPVPGMKKPTRLPTREKAQETLPRCQRCILSTRTIG